MKRWLALLLVLCLALPGRPDPPPDEVDFLLMECWFTIRSADYGNARQIYKFLTPVEHLKNPPERWHVFLGPDALAPLFLDYGEGKFTDVLAAAPGARKAAKARKSSTRELEILLLAAVPTSSSRTHWRWRSKASCGPGRSATPRQSTRSPNACVWWRGMLRSRAAASRCVPTGARSTSCWPACSSRPDRPPARPTRWTARASSARCPPSPCAR